MPLVSLIVKLIASKLWFERFPSRKSLSFEFWIVTLSKIDLRKDKISDLNEKKLQPCKKY